MNSCEIRTLVIIILIITVAVAFMYYIHAKQFMKNANYNERSRIIKTLSRQAAQFALSSKQETDPIKSLVHADYAASNLLSLKTVATNEEIKTATGIQFNELQNEIMTVQNEAIKRLAATLPSNNKKN